MPSLNVLSDEQIASVLSFVRQQFGNQAPAIQPDQVASVRGHLTETPSPAK